MNYQGVYGNYIIIKNADSHYTKFKSVNNDKCFIEFEKSDYAKNRVFMQVFQCFGQPGFGRKMLHDFLQYYKSKYPNASQIELSPEPFLDSTASREEMEAFDDNYDAHLEKLVAYYKKLGFSHRGFTEDDSDDNMYAWIDTVIRATRGYGRKTIGRTINRSNAFNRNTRSKKSMNRILTKYFGPSAKTI
jgi:hypothetical protein